MRAQLSGALNARQIQALQAGAPTAADILDNPEYMEELNQEIQETYRPEVPAPAPTPKAEPKLIPARRTGDRMQRLPPAPGVRPHALPEPTLKALDPEAELDALNRAAEAKLAAKREQEAAAAAAPAPAQQELSPEEALREQIVGALHNHKDAPSEADIAKWKREHGENGVYVLALNEDDVFVFTYLRRGQWMKIQQAVANAQKAELTQNADDTLKEKVLQFSVLWPRPLSIEFLMNSRAGTIDTLFNVIMANSSFLQLSQAMILTTQL